MSNVPKLRFKEFEDEWKQYSLEEIAPLQRGFDLPKSKVVQGSYPIGYSNGVLRTHIEYKVKGPGVFTGRSGTIGKVHYVEENYWPHNTTLWVTNFKNNHPKFIYFLYKNMKFERFDAGSGVPTLNRNDIHALKRYIPEYNEQKKIVLFLNQLERKVEKQKEKVELLKEQKKGYMQKIFNRELRFKDDNGNAFIECREHKFADFLKIPLKEKEENPIKEKLLTVKLHLKGVAVNENVSTLKIGSTTYYKRKAGQFIYGKQNLFNGAFGIVPDYLDGYLSSGDIPTLDFHVDNIEPYYFFYYLSQRDIYKRLENISTGTGSKRIHEAELLKQKIKLPCIKEQQKIVQFLSSMDRKIDREEEKLVALQEQQKGFMQQMFI